MTATLIWPKRKITLAVYVCLPAHQKAELLAFQLAHGITDRDTVDVEYDVIDIPLIRAYQVIRDKDDLRIIEGDEYVMAIREVALRAPLPDWWQPA